MFRACIATHVDKLYNVFVKNGRTLKGVDFSKFGVIERMKLANMAKQIKEWEIGEYIYDDDSGRLCGVPVKGRSHGQYWQNYGWV